MRIKTFVFFMHLDIEVFLCESGNQLECALLSVQVQADLWHAHFHATGAIASAVCCGIGDEQNVHFIHVFQRTRR